MTDKRLCCFAAEAFALCVYAQPMVPGLGSRMRMGFRK